MEAQGGGAPALTNEGETASPDPAAEAGRDLSESAPIVFIDHTGKRFVFPFENCKTYSGFRQLLEQAYASADEATLDNLQNEKYDLLTIDDATVLPAVWETVIKHHLPLQGIRGDHWHTIKIRFWPNTLDPQSDLRGDPQEYFPRHSSRRYPLAELQEDHGPRSREASRGRHLPQPFFDREDVIERHRGRSYSRPRSRSRSKSNDKDQDRRRSGPRRSTSPPPPPSEPDAPSPAWSDIDDDDANSQTLTEDTGSRPLTPPPPPSRTVTTPKDINGNSISYFIDTKWAATKHGTPKTAGTSNADVSKSRQVRNMKMESPLRILKVLQTSAENRTAIQVHTLRGPESSISSRNVNFDWYHLHGDQLDFSQFKDACVNIPNLSERLKTLVNKTLKKIEKENFKIFLDGLFIEPGTVLRGDESNRDNALSVIFTCVPYFDVRAPRKSSQRNAERLHPARTLMQTFYPYEPVQERDEEQAFRKFKSSSSSNNIIYLPSLWVMHIGTDAVVTCGHRPLASEFVNSITTVQEDIRGMHMPNVLPSSVTGDITSSNLVNIRLRDWDGRTLLFTIDECRTYFQTEQKLRELKYQTASAGSDALELVWTTKDGPRRILPRHWQGILRSPNCIFIDISVLGEQTIPLFEEEPANDTFSTNELSTSVPPFFHWPSPKDLKTEDTSDNKDEAIRQFGFIPAETKRSMQCLELVEKWMMGEKRDAFYDNDVEQTFASTDYYRNLPEKSFEDIKDKFVVLLGDTVNLRRGTSQHEVVIESQNAKLASEAASLIDVAHQSLDLFVDKIDKNTMLRRLWGALINIASVIERIHQRGGCKPDAEEFTDPSWHPPLTGLRGWFVRNPKHSLLNGEFVPLPQDEDLVASFKACQDCRRNHRYHDAESAMAHVLEHARSTDGNSATQQGLNGLVSPKKEPNPKDWIRNFDQIAMEETNAGFLALLTQATREARFLLKEIRELADGATSADGRLSDLYTLPHELVKTLRRLILFYLSVERAFHYAEEEFQSKARQKRFWTPRDSNSTMPNAQLDAVKRISDEVKITISAARKDLCNMARSKSPIEIEKRLSLGPEYLCGWLMRRLLVKPVDNSMNVADLYREYLSTLQFQANHRPSKRLLRDINLLQEELSALEQINSWQTNLIVSFKRVLDDRTYPNDVPFRRAIYPFEKILLESCLEQLADALADYKEMNKRCGPLSELTKQSSEINDEDHGKAILVFTVVTIIFLPLSFVTSYLGMNTADIRDMNNKQSLFWEIAIPLTTVTMGSVIFVAYNGEDIRGFCSAVYRRLSGKQDLTTSGRGIGVAQRKRASRLPSDTASTLVDYRSLADDAEYLAPRSAWNQPEYFQEQQFLSFLNTESQNKYLEPSAIPLAEDTWYEPHTTSFSHRHPRGTRYTTDEVRPPPTLAEDVYYASGPEPVDTYRTETRRRNPRQYSTGPRMHTELYSSAQPRMTTRTDTFAYPPPPPPPPPAAPYNPYATDPLHPTIIRIHKRHLDVDSLAAFKLPWEYDLQNPDYYVIFKPLPPWETDELFEHTRRLREGRRGGRRHGGPHRGVDRDYGYGNDA